MTPFPTTARAGDTFRTVRSWPDYPASAGWVLYYRFSPRAAGTPVDVTCTADGDAHKLLVAAATTANWPAGTYSVGAWVVKAGERYTIAAEGGSLVIAPNPASLAGGTDTRSEAERMLAAVQSLISGKATSGVESYTIAGRQLTSYPLPDLLKLERKLQADVDRERIAAGLPPLYGGITGPRRILLRAA